MTIKKSKPTFNLLHKLNYVLNKIIRLLSLFETMLHPTEDIRVLKRKLYKRNFYAALNGLPQVLSVFAATPALSTAKSDGKNTNQSLAR